MSYESKGEERRGMGDGEKGRMVRLGAVTQASATMGLLCSVSRMALKVILHHCHLCPTEAGKACTFRTLPISLARSRARRNGHRARAPPSCPLRSPSVRCAREQVDSRFSAPLIADCPRGDAEHVFLEGRTVWADGSRRPIGSHRAAFSFCLDSTHKANLHLPWVASTTIAARPVGKDDSCV